MVPLCAVGIDIGQGGKHATLTHTFLSDYGSWWVMVILNWAASGLCDHCQFHPGTNSLWSNEPRSISLLVLCNFHLMKRAAYLLHRSIMWWVSFQLPLLAQGLPRSLICHYRVNAAVQHCIPQHLKKFVLLYFFEVENGFLYNIFRLWFPFLLPNLPHFLTHPNLHLFSFIRKQIG